MRPTPDKISAFIAQLRKKMNLKSLVITLAAIVVFTTTYLLILPAFTLDKEEAAEQGGIDVAVEQTVETADEEAPAEQAEEPAAEQKESADAVTEAEEPAAKEEVKEETASPKQDDSVVKEEKKEDKEEVKLLSKKKELTAEKEKTDDFTISAVVDKDAKVPEDVFLQATELTKDTEDFDYDKYYKDALKVLKKDTDNVKGIKTIKFYDISLEAESQDESVEPKAAVNVKIAYEDGLKVNDADNIRIVHFAEQKDGEVKAEVLDSKENKVETTVNKKSEMTEASFDTEGFSVFAVAEMELVNEFTITNPDGKKVTYLVTATYGPKAEIPEGATLSVTEFGKLNAEYKKAYDAVVSKKSSDDDSFDEEAFGMNAFDISIVDAEGNKVEPKDTVDISLKIKELPEEAINSFASGSLEIQHLDESQNELKVETVASVEDGSIQINDKSAVAEFKLASFSTFTIDWSGNTTTIHYGYMDGNRFVEFEQQPSPTDPYQGWAYLIYDFKDTDGTDYNYAGTYYHTSVTNNPVSENASVIPALRYNNSNWKYYATSHGYEGNNLRTDGNWQTAADDSHLYVVYEKPEIPDGGSPTLDPHTEKPDIPSILKESVDNEDNTNTLSLSITSSSNDMEVQTLADVIIVLDLSSSMRQYIERNAEVPDYKTNPDSRYYQALDAVKRMANSLYERNRTSGKELFRLGLITFAGNAQVRQEMTSNRTEFINSVNEIDGFDGKGTNWEHSLKLANELEISDNRATFVIFVTDGEPTASQTRYGDVLNNSQLPNQNMFMAGTNNGGIPDNQTFTGKSYDPLHFYLRTGTFGTTDALSTYGPDNVKRTAAATYDDIKSILDHDKNMYVIGISTEITEKDVFVELQNRLPDKHVLPATSSDALEEAFRKIESEITGVLGWGDIKMVDGITDLTNTVAKTGLVDFDSNFTYYKSTAPAEWKNWSTEEKEAYQLGIKYAPDKTPPSGYDAGWSDAQRAAFQKGQQISFTEWSAEEMAAVNCQPANYNTQTGSVEWNMGAQFMPEDGVTYKVSFKCWPSQEAYDILAKCRNDESFYNTLTDDQKAQIVRTGNPGSYSYTLKTNKPGAETTYKTATKTGKTISVTGEDRHLPFGEVPDLHLAEEKINIKKEWENELDARKEHSITLGVAADGEETESKLFAKMTLDSPDWLGSAFISTGQMEWDASKNKLIVLETGHDFTLTEKVTGGPDWRWELKSETYRPMVITDSRRPGYEHPKAAILQKVDREAEANYVLPARDGTGNSYYKLLENADAALTATNLRRSNLNLTKHVVRVNDDETENIVDDKFKDEQFTFKVKIDESSVEEATGEDVWFSIVDENGDTVFEPDVTNATAETQDVDSENTNVHNFHYDAEKGIITYRWGDDEELTTYKVVSVSGTIYSCKTGYFHVADETEFTVTMKPAWNLRVTNLPTGSTYRFTEVDIKEGFECLGSELTTKVGTQDPTTADRVEDVTASGTINKTNTEYTVAYFNKANLYDIKIVKTDNGTPPKNLAGATFKLYKKNSEGVYDVIEESLEVPEAGLTVEGLSIGDYKLEEITPPDGYNIKIKQIFFKITSNPNQVITLDADYGTDASVGGSSKDELYVQNPPGEKLPMTGGIGTTIFYILGSILAIGCGIVLIARRRAGISR